MNYPSYFTDMPVLQQSRPDVAVRVVSGYVWDSIIYPQLQQHLHGRAPAPRLGPPSATTRGVHVSDPQSLAVCVSAEDFAYRLSLRLNLPVPGQPGTIQDDLQEYRLHGCALIYFILEPNVAVSVPYGTTVHGFSPSNRGLTVGGAREWLVQRNLSFDIHTMEVFIVNSSGARWGPIRK